MSVSLNKFYDIANECVLVFNCSVSDIVYNRKTNFSIKIEIL